MKKIMFLFLLITFVTSPLYSATIKIDTVFADTVHYDVSEACNTTGSISAARSSATGGTNGGGEGIVGWTYTDLATDKFSNYRFFPYFPLKNKNLGNSIIDSFYIDLYVNAKSDSSFYFIFARSTRTSTPNDPGSADYNKFVGWASGTGAYTAVKNLVLPVYSTTLTNGQYYSFKGSPAGIDTLNLVKTDTMKYTILTSRDSSNTMNNPPSASSSGRTSFDSYYLNKIMRMRIYSHLNIVVGKPSPPTVNLPVNTDSTSALIVSVNDVSNGNTPPGPPADTVTTDTIAYASKGMVASSTSFSTARNASSADSLRDYLFTGVQYDSSNNKWSINRSFIPFIKHIDTIVSIVECTLFTKVRSKQEGVHDVFGIYKTTSGGNLSVSDFNKITDTLLSDTVSIENQSINEYTPYVLNQSGRTYVQQKLFLGDTVQFGIISDADIHSIKDTLITHIYAETLLASADAWISHDEDTTIETIADWKDALFAVKNNATVNFHSHDTARAWFDFDINNIAHNDSVVSAILNLSVLTSYGGTDIKCYLVKVGHPIENQIRWSAWKTGSSWNTAGGTSANDIYYSLPSPVLLGSDITTIMRYVVGKDSSLAWNGLLVKTDSSTAGRCYYSRHTDGGNNSAKLILTMYKTIPDTFITERSDTLKYNRGYVSYYDNDDIGSEPYLSIKYGIGGDPGTDTTQYKIRFRYSGDTLYTDSTGVLNDDSSAIGWSSKTALTNLKVNGLGTAIGVNVNVTAKFPDGNQSGFTSDSSVNIFTRAARPNALLLSPYDSSRSLDSLEFRKLNIDTCQSTNPDSVKIILVYNSSGADSFINPTTFAIGTDSASYWKTFTQWGIEGKFKSWWIFKPDKTITVIAKNGNGIITSKSPGLTIEAPSSGESGDGTNKGRWNPQIDKIQ